MSEWDMDLGGIREAVAEALAGVHGSDDDAPAGEDVMDGVYDVGTPAALQVNTVSGEVRVRVGDDDVIRVHAEKHGGARARANTMIEQRTEGNTVILRTRGGSASGAVMLGMVGGNNVCSVDYDIVVPRRCAVRVKAVSADVAVEGPEGDLDLETVSGDVRIEDVRGDLAIGTVSGDITARRVSGDLTLRTTSGDARLLDSSLADFNLHTVSGDLAIETPLRAGAHYQAKTVSGDLHLTVPPETGVTVVMKSMSGDVQCELPSQVISKGRHKWTGRINGGGANIEMNSVSGDLRIMGGTRGAAPAEAVRTDMPARTQEDGTTDILQMLQDGEIDVEEALRRLEAR